MDTRLGLDSASSIERLKLCPGSKRQSQGMPEFRTPEEIKWGESGDRIHLWLQVPGFIDLDQDELDVAKACVGQREKLLNQLFPNWDLLSEKRIDVEQRLWLRNESGAHYFSGQADWRARLGHVTSVIIDYKTNRGEQDEPADNMQLRALAVLEAFESNWSVEQVYAAIIQPLAGFPEPPVMYRRIDLIDSFKQINEIIANTQKADAPLNPGKKQCRFCPARLSCPALNSVENRVAAFDVRELVGMTGQQLADMLDACSTAETKIDLVKEKAKELLKLNPDSVPTWGLKGTGSIRKVTNAVGLYAQLTSMNLMDRDTFMQKCISVGVGDLEDAIRSRNNLTEIAAAEMLKLCSEFIEVKPKQPSLKKLTPKDLRKKALANV